MDPETNITNKNEYSLNLSGSLKANPAENEDVITSSDDMKTFTVKNSGNNQMTIDMTGTTVANRSLSEELTNKPVVEIDLSKYSTATDDDDKDSRLVRSATFRSWTSPATPSTVTRTSPWWPRSTTSRRCVST